MQKISSRFGFLIAFAAATAGVIHAQGRSAPDWTTDGADAQRSSWIAVDPWISIDTMPQFTLVWKLKVDNEPRQMNALTAPSSMANLNSFRGFKSLVFVGGSAYNVYAIDYDFGTLFWKTHFNYSSGITEYMGSPACPGGMTAGVVRPTSVTPTLQLPFMGFARPPRPAKGEVGEPGKGAAGLTVDVPGRGRGAGAGGRGAPPPVAAAPPPAGRGRGLNAVFAMGADGIVRALNPNNADAVMPPAKFLPPNAQVTGLIHADGFMYAVTSSACGSAPDAVWAMDVERDERPVVMWKSGGAPVSAPAFGPDGTLYVTVGEGTSAYANSVVALAAKTLTVKDWITLPGAAFRSAPVVLIDENAIRIAAAAGDGRLYIVDAGSLGGADHKSPAFVAPASLRTAVEGLSAWRDNRGTRGILASTRDGNGNGAIVAFRFDAKKGSAAIEEAWTSRGLVRPQPAAIMNGVVFALSAGTASSPAVLYALHPATGNEIWTSGNTITSFATAGLSTGTGQLFVVTHDNTVWSFGIPLPN